MLIGYARVSIQDQNPELQLAALKAAGCERLFEEKASGAKRDRPELNAVLSHLRKGDTLVVWKLDRLPRSLKQMTETVELLHERGIGFRSLAEAIDTTTSGGRLIFHIFGALAEFERSIIRERTTAGLGQLVGAVVFRSCSPRCLNCNFSCDHSKWCKIQPFDPPDVVAALCLPGVVIGLHVEPEACAVAESCGEASGDICRHGTGLVRDLVDRLARQPEMGGEIDDSHAALLQIREYAIAQHTPWMDGPEARATRRDLFICHGSPPR